jgi:hypothetical protein
MSAQRNECRVPGRLHKWKRASAEGEDYLAEVAVDHRAALADALLGYDVSTGEVVAEFERLVFDSDYEQEGR